VLEAEELRDPPRELSFDRRQNPVGVDDAPDRLDQAQTLLPREPLGHEPRELVEVHALPARLLRETKDLFDVVFRDTEVFPGMPGDPLPLFGREAFVGVRDLEIPAPDLLLTLKDGTVFLIESEEGVTGLVLLGRGEMRFAPTPEADPSAAVHR